MQNMFGEPKYNGHVSLQSSVGPWYIIITISRYLNEKRQVVSCFVFFQNTFFFMARPLCNRLPDTSMKLVIFIMILFLHKIILHLPCMLCIKTEWARKFPVLKPYHFQKHDPFSSIDPPSPHVNSLYCDFVSQSHWTESGDAGDTRFKYGRKSKCGQFAAKHHRAQIHLWKIWLVFASLSKSEIFQGN